MRPPYKNFRLAADKRVLIIENFEDFALWHIKAELGISMIAWKIPIPESVKLAAQNLDQSYIDDSRLIDGKISSSGYPNEDSKIPSTYDFITETINKIWLKAIPLVYIRKEGIETELRLNSASPSKDEAEEHRKVHDDAIVCPLEGAPTTFINALGETFALAGHVILFDGHEMPHYIETEDIDTKTQDVWRATLVSQINPS